MSCSDELAEYASTAPAVANASAPPTINHGASLPCDAGGGAAEPIAMSEPDPASAAEPASTAEPAEVADPVAVSGPLADPDADADPVAVADPVAAQATAEDPPL